MSEEAAGEVEVLSQGAGPGLEEQPAGPSGFGGSLHGDGRRLTHFVVARRDLEEEPLLCHGATAPTAASYCRIPAVDPQALQDLAVRADQVGAQVDGLLRSVYGALQAMSALSVGCIHTYRDGVESLGEAVDTSIRSMYTLMARCEELDREMQPVPALARRIRDMKSALERLEGLCK